MNRRQAKISVNASLIKAMCILMLCIFFILNSSHAQDLHFTQFFANPISYNPATTGFYDGSYRFGVNHKQQWPWAIKGRFLNYNSSSGYADFSFLDKKINDLDWAGIGVNFINDQAGDGTLTANKGYLSMAYHKGLDRQHKQFISIGLTVGYVHRSINFGALYFNNQWVDGIGFDLNLSNQEGFATENTGYIDLGIGLQGQNQIKEKLQFLYGFSLLHINRPQESFYDQSNRLGMRFLFHGEVKYMVNNVLDLTGSFYYTRQKNVDEFLMGALASISTQKVPKKKESKLIAGVFYRWKDAISPMVGYQFHRTRVLINYDVNLSQLSAASRGNGGFELSFVQIGTFKNKKNFNYKSHCPKF